MTKNIPRSEAEQDLTDIEGELTLMHEIRKCSEALAIRPDVDADYYRRVSLKVLGDITKGNQVKDKIVEYLKSL